MSLLNKTYKNTTNSAAIDQLLKAFQELSGFDNCSISDGVFNICDNGNWIRMFLPVDALELIADKDSDMARAAGIKEICFQKSVSIDIDHDIRFNKGIIIRSKFNINLIENHNASSINICGLNIICDTLMVSGYDTHINDSIINAQAFLGPHGVDFVCPETVKMTKYESIK